MKKFKKYFLSGFLAFVMMLGCGGAISASSSTFTNLKVAGNAYLPSGTTASATNHAVVNMTNVANSEGVTVAVCESTKANYGTKVTFTGAKSANVYYQNSSTVAKGTQVIGNAVSLVSWLGTNYISGSVSY